MASGSNSSSKRKTSSSSSYKKKPSKKSSEVKKRKRSRSRKRDKLRKRSRRELSISCSDDDSRTGDSVSVSFSDSENDYRCRKGRSRTRMDGKSKKKSKRSSSVRDDSRDSAVRKKRKGSKGSDGFVVKKKYRHGKSDKEGSRRGARVDYFSGDSESCSTCRGGSDSEASYFERSRGRSKGREKYKTRKGRDKERDRDRYRDRSCSSCSEHDEQSRYQSEERLMDDNYSRHLKSVLSVPNEYEEGRYQGKSENTEEVILAYDDCPSSKSNDSYDGVRKKETFNQPYSAPEERQEYDGILEDDRRPDTSYLMNEKEIRSGKKADDAFTSKSKTTQSARISKDDVGAPYGKRDHVSNTESSKTAENLEVSTGVVSSVTGDLETILRQKALENFRKFRGGRQANTNLDDQKNENDIGVRQSHESEHEANRTEFSRKIVNRVGVARDVKALESGSTTRVEGKSITSSSARGIQIPDGNSKQFDSCNTMHDDDTVIDAKVTQKRIINLGNIRKTNQDSLVGRRESFGDHSVKKGLPDGKSKDASTIASKIVPETPKAAAGSFDPRETKKTPKSTSEAKSIVNRIIPVPSKVAVGSSDPSKSDTAPGSTSSEAKSIVNKTFPDPPKVAVGSSDPSKTDKASGPAASEATSCLTPATGEHGSTESGKEAAGGSEFQQKTMTVMRGGEMVQVSYKVYIPKKTPALARRQLRH